MKARGVKSPNIADALCISEYFCKDIAFGLWSPKQRAIKKRKLPSSDYNQASINQQNWMAV